MAVNPTWVGDACESADMAGIPRAVIMEMVNYLMPESEDNFAHRLELVAAEKKRAKIPTN